MSRVEECLISSARTLSQPPYSRDQLLPILDGTEKYLSKVEQSPAPSIVAALSPLTKALISEKLLKHSDVDVRVGVASCMSEITRITAPEAPYDDDKMKDVLQLIVSSFENISDTSSISYLKRLSILETVAKVRSCVIMLDLECDQMVIEMFQHFFRDIRDHHPEVVFNSMETIMTLILEESEDISPDVLNPILSTLKKNNETALPGAKKLAERVIQSSADKLKTFLPQALKALNICVKDYSEVLASMCQDSTWDVLNGELVTEKSISSSPVGSPSPQEFKECTEETARNGVNEPETDEIARNGANEPETEETAMNGANEPETEETAMNGANEPETEETTMNGVNEPEIEETVMNSANEPETEETATNAANEPENEAVVDAKCSKNLDSENVSNANLVSEEPATLEAKVDQVANENGRQSNSDNDSVESPDSVDSKKHSEQGNTGEEIPTSPNEVLPHVEAAMSSENVNDISMQLSPSGPHENEDVNISTPAQVGSQPEQDQVTKSARTKRNVKSAKKQKRSGKKQPAKKADKKYDSMIEEDGSKKDDDNVIDMETKLLEQTEKMQVFDDDNNSDAKEQKDSGEKLCAMKAEKNSTSTEGSKSENDGGAASGSETKVSDDQNIPVAKMQKGTGKKQPVKKATADSTMVEEDESKNDDGNASDSEANSLDKIVDSKVSEEENLPVAKKQRSRRKQPDKKAKKAVALIEENESKNDDGNASDSEANSLDKIVDSKVSEEENLPVAKKQRSRRKQPDKKAKKSVALIEENESENNGGGDSEIQEDSPFSKVGKKSGLKQSSNKDGTKSSAREDDGEDVVTSPRPPLRSTRDGGNKEKSSRMSSKRKRTPGSENASGTIEYGKNLVGSKIKVWWPHDRKFYNGVIRSFDSVKKKHAVLYADGDEENLNLKREKWEFVGDDPVSDADEAVENSSYDSSPDMKKKKGASTEASSKPVKVAISDKSKLKDIAKKSGVKSKDDDKSKYSAKATGKSKDVNSKQDSQKTAKSKAKTPQSATGSSKAKESDKGTVKGNSQDTPKSRTSDAKSGKKRRR